MIPDDTPSGGEHDASPEPVKPVSDMTVPAPNTAEEPGSPAPDSAAERLPSAPAAADTATSDAETATSDAETATSDAGEADDKPDHKPDLSPAACAKELAERFPGLFAATPPLPIKLRIHIDIQQRAPHVFTRKSLSNFLRRYTTSTAYLRALSQATQRHDLDGQPAGELAGEHRDAAKAEVERRRTITRERQDAERKAARTARQTAGANDGQPPASGDAPEAPRRPRSKRGPRPAQRHEAKQGQGAASVPGAAHAHGVSGQGSTRRETAAREPGGPAAGNPARKDRQRNGARPGKAGPRQAPRDSRSDRPHDRGRTSSAPSSSADNTPLSTDPAQRERQILLRAFEKSPLSKANFSALRMMSESSLDEQLTIARKERGDR